MATAKKKRSTKAGNAKNTKSKKKAADYGSGDAKPLKAQKGLKRVTSGSIETFKVVGAQVEGKTLKIEQATKKHSANILHLQHGDNLVKCFMSKQISDCFDSGAVKIGDYMIIKFVKAVEMSGGRVFKEYDILAGKK